MKKFRCLFMALIFSHALHAAVLKGRVITEGSIHEGIAVNLNNGQFMEVCKSDGSFQFNELPLGRYLLSISALGFEPYKDSIEVIEAMYQLPPIMLKPRLLRMKEVVITTTLGETERAESPVPIEIYKISALQKNPGSCLFDLASMINGLRPQITCNVCQAGDIRINGMDGPYSLVLLDGMPIVSGLSGVYGMSGIPAGLLERLEVVKGPASTLYGSEAMAGIINVITKKPGNTFRAGIDHFSTSWQEHQSDLWLQTPLGKNHAVAAGLSHYGYDHPIDHNQDGFMDLALQKRISVFNSWRFAFREGKYLRMAVRFFNERRDGGEMEWTPAFLQSDSIYGESIRIKRWEVLASQQLPVKENIQWQLAVNRHQQNSTYGLIPFNAIQTVVFGQIFWNRQIGSKHSLLGGTGLRYNDYNDDTPATNNNSYTMVSRRVIPGIFLQDEWKLIRRMKLLSGYRADFDLVHGWVHSPRLAWQWKHSDVHEWRAGYGAGYRVVNLFAEDHAALSGSREVVVLENLKPERSWNVYSEYRMEKQKENYGIIINTQVFYTHFNNRITGDFDTDPQKIFYRNLNGFAYTAGASGNLSLQMKQGWSLSAGVTFNEVILATGSVGGSWKMQQQIYAPRWSGVWDLSYTFKEASRIDITSNWYGPMRLPVQQNDYRPEFSPFVHLINLKLSHSVNKHIDLWAGVKNLLNITGRDPLMRPHDPFDKRIDDPVDNPNGYTFDMAYNYAPMQGIRFYIGVSLKS